MPGSLINPVEQNGLSMSDVVPPDLMQTASAARTCRCGSGLREPRCCGLDPGLRIPIAAEGPFSESLTALTRAYRAETLDAARAIAIEILEEAPGQKDALGALFNILKHDGKLEAAGVIVERMTAANANDPVARVVAAQFFLARGDLPRAQIHARMLVRLAPEACPAHQLMGRTFLAGNNPRAAEHHFRTALDLPDGRQSDDKNQELRANLALALRGQGRLDEARDIFKSLGDEADLEVDVLVAWAGLEEAARDFDFAGRLLDRALQRAPGNPQAVLARAGLYRRIHAGEKALDLLASIGATSTGSDGHTVNGLLQKGQILDSLGRYREAFAAFEDFKTRERLRTGHSYQADQANALVSSLRGFFTEGRTRLLPRAETRTDMPQPIFIVGFPRSGTTLVEQTLSSHEDIWGGDELPIINSIAQRAQSLLGSPAPYPMALSELWFGDRVDLINTLRDLYLNEAAQIGALDPGKRWFTDKMPLNETHLGLISLLFPQSPIVHVVRHPLDVVLSVFSNGLTHGFYCAYALESAAQHYALIADLVAHYRSALPLRYHAVRYEDLVADQEKEVRSMLNFIGAPFHPHMLEFHENLRPARTASHAQVTEKLYSRSRYRYRHYLEELAPVMPMLQPVIEQLGYTIDG